MDWIWVLVGLIGGIAILFVLGFPIAFAFMMVNLFGVFLLWNGETGLNQLVLNMFNSVSKFSLLPIPMFLFMGEIMFRTGLGSRVFDALGKWMGNLPGRLSLLAVGSGTLFSVLSGSSAASTALLGSLLLPDMEKKGYHSSMSIGPIIGSSGLAVMIPPTALGVILASLANISVGHFLIAIVVPGMLLAVIIALYVIIRATLQPALAPSYEVEKVSLREKLKASVMYILPLGLILFLVVGVILFGYATPTQSAVLGAVGALVLSACYKNGLTWRKLWDSLVGTLRNTSMIFMIIVGSTTFSQILSYTGITQGLVGTISSWDLSPLFILALIQIFLLILGCVMDPLSIMMITLPVLMPIAATLQFDPIWFAAIMLLNMQIATFTPPFGMDLFAMKGVARHLSMSEIYRSVVPIFLLNLLLMVLMIAFPSLTLWLPDMMNR